MQFLQVYVCPEGRLWAASYCGAGGAVVIGGGPLEGHAMTPKPKMATTATAMQIHESACFGRFRPKGFFIVLS
jgi:hypothetical protein